MSSSKILTKHSKTVVKLVLGLGAIKGTKGFKVFNEKDKKLKLSYNSQHFNEIT